MQKRAQITMFVILGIVVVMALIIGFAFRKSISEQISSMEIGKSEQAKQLEGEISSYASSCLKKVAIEGVQSVFANGGYYSNAPQSMPYSFYALPYYVYEGKENVPSLDEVAVNLAKYIDASINACISSYSPYLVIGKPASEVKLGRSLSAQVSHSLSMSRGETSVTVRKFDAEVDVDARHIYESGIEFFTKVKNISSFDLVTPSVMALRQKYEYYMPQPADENTYVYVLMFNNSIEGNRNIDYNFALKFRPSTEPKGSVSEFLAEVTGGASLEASEEQPEQEVALPDVPTIDDASLDVDPQSDNSTSREQTMQYRKAAAYLDKLDDVFKPQDNNFTELDNEA